jgi:hypothetical protein
MECVGLRLGRTRPAGVRSSGSEILSRIRSLAGYTIGTLEPSFRKRQLHPALRDYGSHSAPGLTVPNELEFGEAPRLDRGQKIESGPLWQGRRFSANLAMSDQPFRASGAGTGRHRGSTRHRNSPNRTGLLLWRA